MADQGTAPAAAAADNGGAPEAPAGQDPSATGDALYQEYVADHPEELRPFLVDVLRKQDAKITPRLQEAAELRKRFEPFTQVEGFDQLTPSDVSEFIEFRNEILADPDAFGSWMAYMVAQNEDLQQAIPEELWASIGESNGWLSGEGEEGFDDGGAGVEDDGLAQQFAAFRDELREELAPVIQTVQQQQAEQQQSRIVGQLQERLGALEEQHGALEDDQRDFVVRLAQGYANTEDPLGAAFEDYLRITGQAEGNATDRKLRDATAGPTLPGSRPDTSPPQYAHDDPELKKAALSRFRA